MSDINTYANEAAITALTPINGDLVLNIETNALYLCTDSSASGIARWKKFTNDGEALPFVSTNSLSFGGTNEYAISDSTVGTDGLTEMTITFWAKTSNLAQSPFLFGNRDGVGGTSAQTFPGNALYWYLYNSSAQYVKVTTTNISSVSNDSWVHFGLVFNGSGSSADDKAKIYLNGELATSETNTVTHTSIANRSLPLRLANDPLVPNQYWNGLIDEFAIIPSALSQADITSISSTPADLTAFDPYHWYRMESTYTDGTDTKIEDSGTNSAVTQTPIKFVNTPSLSPDVKS